MPKPEIAVLEDIREAVQRLCEEVCEMRGAIEFMAEAVEHDTRHRYGECTHAHKLPDPDIHDAV